MKVFIESLGMTVTQDEWINSNIVAIEALLKRNINFPNECRDKYFVNLYSCGIVTAAMSEVITEQEPREITEKNGKLIMLYAIQIAANYGQYKIK